MAVLHTWTQQLVYHPHVHCLVKPSFCVGCAPQKLLFRCIIDMAS
jgi:Putative transposase